MIRFRPIRTNRTAQYCVLGALLYLSSLWSGCAHYQDRPLRPEANAARLESRSLSDPALRHFLETNLHRTFSQWPPQQWDFETLTLVAFFYHPSLDVASAAWNVAKAGIITAGGRPNPSIGFAPQYVFNPAGEPPWVAAVSFDIPIETAGKRGYRIAQATHLSQSALLNIVTTAWQVRSNLRSRLLDYAAARQRAELLHNQLQIQQQIVALLEQRLQVGAISRSDLTLPRVALARAGSEYADAIRQAAEARVGIAEALGLPVKSIEGVAIDFQLPLATDAGSGLTSADARQQALQGRPDVLAALSDYAASQAALQIEIAKQYPDIHLNTGYEYDQGLQKWGVLGFGTELPLLNRNEGPIAEAEARRTESAARFEAVQAKVIAEIDRALAARAAATDQVTQQAQLARLTRQQAAAAEAMANAGAADKLELASAQFEASANDLAYLEAQVRAQQALAQLEDAVQRPLAAWPDLEQGRAPHAKQEKP